MVQKKQAEPVALDEPKTDSGQEHDWDEIRERFWRVVQEIGERNAHLDPDDVLREVTEVVEEVRQERYERARRTQGCH
jgi:hypothetical protein